MVRTAPSDVPISYALAPAQGTVAIVDGCVRLERDEGGSVVLVYPYDYQVVWESGRAAVQDGKGRLLYAVGQRVEIGGSVLAEGTAEKIVPSEDRRHCEGPFFLVMPEPESR